MSWFAEQPRSEEELCLSIGRNNHELLEMARLRAPNANSREIALAVLDLLLPDRDGEQWRHAATLVDELMAQRSSYDSSRRGHDMTGPYRNDDMEEKNLMWVGVAVLAAILCGAAAFWFPRGQKGNGGDHALAGAPQTHSGPTPKPEVPAQDTIETVRFAAAVLSGKARETGTEAEKAGDLFSMAMFWWSGTAREWDQTACSAGLSPLHTLPASDDVLLVSVYETALHRSAMPTTRFESSAIIRDAVRERKLRHVETYEIPAGTKLTQSSFTR